ncbi:MAG: alpha/beta hydrolase [Pirellulaceae bacterium]
MHRYVCASLIVGCYAVAMGQDTPPERVITVSDIPYYAEQPPDDYARSRCKLDVRYPRDQSTFSTLVWFHGGGLKEGDRRSGDAVAQRFTAAGVAVVLVDYRLSPQATCPAYIEDAATAVAWTIQNIGRYGGDPRRVFVSGHSAGGFLTAMVGLDGSYLGKHGVATSQLAGLLPVSGQMITHFTIREERHVPATTPLVDALAPAYHAAKDSPPCLCIVGDKDLPARMEENVYCAALFKAAGNDQFQCQVFPGRDHSTIISGILEPNDPVADVMIRFIQTHSQRAGRD